jgi:hypothetical protein
MNDSVVMGSTVVAFVRNDAGVFSWQTEERGHGGFESLIHCVQHFLDVMRPEVPSIPLGE